MKISEQYIKGLKKAYLDRDMGEDWDFFENLKHGVSAGDLIKLKEKYPDVPESLLDLLKYADGTYYRKYGDKEICLYFLGSDAENYKYPYYLMSAEQILKSCDVALACRDYIERLYDDQDIKIDERITKNADTAKWLHFSDCMNNGGSSWLFVDFTPSEKGKVGQIGRFLHDPDEIEIIADSFDDYLKMLIDAKYRFIHKDTSESDYLYEIPDDQDISLKLTTDYWIENNKYYYGDQIHLDTCNVRLWHEDIPFVAILRPEHIPEFYDKAPTHLLPQNLKKRIDKYEKEITALEKKLVPSPTPEMEKEYANYYDAAGFIALAKKISFAWRDRSLPLAERFPGLFAMLTEAYGIIGGVSFPDHLMRDDGGFAIFFNVLFATVNIIINTANDTGVAVPKSVSDFYDFLDGFIDRLIEGGNRLHGIERSKTQKEEEETSDLEEIANSEDDDTPLEKRLDAFQKLGEDTLSIAEHRIRYYRKAINLINDTYKSEPTNELPDYFAPFVERIKSELLALKNRGIIFWMERVGKAFFEDALEWIKDEEDFKEVTEVEFIKGLYPRKIFMELHEKNGVLCCTTQFYFSNRDQIMHDLSLVATVRDGKINFELMPYLS